MEVQSGSHSDKLSDKDRICELVTHNVKPDCLDKYLKATENLIGKDTQNYRPLFRTEINRDNPRPPSLYCCARNILNVHRDSHLKEGVCTLVLGSLATVTSCIDPSERIVTKSPKVEPLLIFSIFLIPQ